MAVFRDIPRAFFSGSIVPGARLQFFAAADDEPLPAYAQARVASGLPDYTLVPSVEHPLNLEADSAGRWPLFWLDPALTYRARVTDPDGNTLADLDHWDGYFDEELAAQPRDDSGRVIPFAQLTIYFSGTTELAPYEFLGDEEEFTGPITADASGTFLTIILRASRAYRVLLHDRYGRLIYDVDPYVPFPLTIVQVFEASGTWAKPRGAQWVEVVCVGGGGGGGSGGRFLLGGGGRGGAGGGYSSFSVPASSLPDSIDVVVGAGGAGGAGIPSGISIGGNRGTDGGASSFGNYLKALGGDGGRGGQGSNGAPTPTGGAGLISDGATGGDSSYTDGGTGFRANWAPSGGGGGGGDTSSNNIGSGSPGGAQPNFMPGPFAGGAGGAPGSPGVYIAAAFMGTGAGGSDGMAGTSGFIAGGASTDSPMRGAGGGGAGSTTGTTTGKDGGKGGDGLVVVVSHV